ncbi:hypothetical protein SMICM304S_07343 [Streptomyces microflavus]
MSNSSPGGPRSRGPFRAAGLTEAWSPGSESMAEVLDRLLGEGVEGRRIALQLHGEPLPGFIESLQAAGAEVIGVPVYRWMPPQDIAPLDRLLDATAARGLDAVTFTSAPASAWFPGPRGGPRAPPGDLGALRDDVLAACVGPVTALPLQARSIPTVSPNASASARSSSWSAPTSPPTARVLPVAGHRVEIRGHAVLVDDELRAVPPAGMALLHTLARRPGWVVARADLLRALPGSGTDEHAVETAMARLRAAGGAPADPDRRQTRLPAVAGPDRGARRGHAEWGPLPTAPDAHADGRPAGTPAAERPAAPRTRSRTLPPPGRKPRCPPGAADPDGPARHLEERHPGGAPLSVLPTEFYQDGATDYRTALAAELDDRVQAACCRRGRTEEDHRA